MAVFLSLQKAMLEDFHELRDRVERGGYYQPNYAFYIIIIAHILFLDLLGWWTMKTFGTGWLPYIIASVFLATAQVGSHAAHFSVKFMHYLSKSQAE